MEPIMFTPTSLNDLEWKYNSRLITVPSELIDWAEQQLCIMSVRNQPDFGKLIIRRDARYSWEIVTRQVLIEFVRRLAKMNNQPIDFSIDPVTIHGHPDQPCRLTVFGQELVLLADATEPAAGDAESASQGTPLVGGDGRPVLPISAG